MGQQQGPLPPGFRFSPTDEELVAYYLKNKVCGKSFHNGVIADLDIYKHEPWELSTMSVLDSKDPVWYFFNARDQRHSRTARINRTTSKGYWKATGKDRKVCTGSQTVGVKKTLIYYEGRAPTGIRTDWLMHEYKLIEDVEKKGENGFAPTLCRIRKKSGPGPRNGEQYGAPVIAFDDGETEKTFGIVTEEEDEKKPLESEDDHGDRSTDLSDGYGDGRPIKYDDERMEAIAHFLLFEDTKTLDDAGTMFCMDNSVIPNIDSTTFGPPPIAFDDDHVHEFLHPDEHEHRMLNMLGDGDSGIGDEINGDYIELFDMSSPLSEFYEPTSSPTGSFGLFEPQAFSNNCVSDGSPAEGILHGNAAAAISGQGSAPRRMKLQCPVVSYGRTKESNDVLDRAAKLLVKPEQEEDASCKPSYVHDQNRVDPGSGGKSSTTTRSFLSKHQTYQQTVSVHTAPPQVFYSLKEDSVAANENACLVTGSMMEETDRVTAMLRACAISEDSGRAQGEESHGIPGADCYGIDGASCKTNRGSSCSHNGEGSQRIERESDGFRKDPASGDCEANLLPMHPSREACSRPKHHHHHHHHHHHLRDVWRSKLTRLVGRVKSSSICMRLKRIEDHINSRFHERVSGYGKRASQFFAANEQFINPYDLVQKGVLSLVYLLGAVLVILLTYLGFHIFVNGIFI